MIKIQRQLEKKKNLSMRFSVVTLWFSFHFLPICLWVQIFVYLVQYIIVFFQLYAQYAIILNIQVRLIR